MAVSWQIPRNCLAWILLSQLALLAPHTVRLPWWVMCAYLICALWRIMIYQGRWSQPPKWIKVLLALLCFGGIYQTYGNMRGLEPTVALLFTGFCLKLLEITTKRDVYVIIFLGYFVAVTAFLFSQNIFLSLYMLFTLMLVTTALVALHQHSFDQFNMISFKKASMILLQAAPLMLLLFVVFPRFQPFWSVPTAKHQAKTGISDSMSPGDISRLSQTSDVAFRVEFDGATPQRRDMYWRGLVLSEFDGRSWRQGRWRKRLLSDSDVADLYRQLKSPLSYSVIQEATNQRWLFSLPLAYSADPSIKIVNDYRLIRTSEIHSRIRYQVLSDTRAPIAPEADDQTLTIEVKLPESGNLQSRQFAQRMRLEAESTEQFISNILKHFNTENFVYTLKPPLLGEDTVDEFLFSTRRGFCGHYASSFVFLMRAAGVPARVVVGYQGGEVNPVNGTVIIHQFDAHSWAEVWLPDQGWVRVDPTAAVSPSRIELGLEMALQEEGSFLSDNPLTPLRYRNVSWINEMRFQLDALEYYWSKWVLQYDENVQLSLFKNLFGEIKPWRIAGLMLVLMSIILLVVAAVVLKGRGKQRQSEEIRLYLKMCKKLDKTGHTRAQNEGAVAFARRVAEQQPAWKQHLLAATRAFVSLSYDRLSVPQRRALVKQLRREVVKLNIQLTAKSADD